VSNKKEAVQDRNLPYSFDLLWDVKTMGQVERIAKFEADCSDADPYDLYELFESEGMEIPECLKGFETESLWIHENGHWQASKPLPDEMRGYKRAIYK